MYIYLDERGDLGFDFRKRGTSRTFIITLLLCHTQEAQRAIRNRDWRLYAVVLNKRRVYESFRSRRGQNKLYNFLARFLIEKLPLRETYTNVHLMVDRSKNREEIRDFNQYLQNQIERLLPLNTSFQVEHLNSMDDAGLQAVDLFCWGIGRKYEMDDPEWYSVYCEHIVYEEIYLPEPPQKK